MKRFLSILLVAVLALGLMATSAFAAGISVEAKETTVELKASDVKFQSCLAVIDFDHSKLTLKNVEAAEAIAGAVALVSDFVFVKNIVVYAGESDIRDLLVCQPLAEKRGDRSDSGNVLLDLFDRILGGEGEKLNKDAPCRKA